ncbi:MFS transporter, partial [Streptomyces sp. NPDC058427]
RATSVVVGGVTVACVAGVPAGAWLGGQWGWRAAFWAVALVSLPAIAVIAATIPAGRPPAALPSARAELRSLAGRRLRLTLLTSALVQGATFCAFSYLEPIAVHVTRFGPAWVPVLLALFGVGSFVGVTVCGRVIDSRPVALTSAGLVALTAGWALFAAAADSRVAVIALVLVLGMLAFGTGTALISHVFRLAEDAPTLAGSFATSAFNVGGALGPWLGGLAIGAGLGFRSPLWVSALLMLLALGTAGASRGGLRGRDRRPRGRGRRRPCPCAPRGPHSCPRRPR